MLTCLSTYFAPLSGNNILNLGSYISKRDLIEKKKKRKLPESTREKLLPYSYPVSFEKQVDT